MGAKGVISFIAIIVLLSPFVASQSNRDPQQLSLENLINLEDPIDEDTADELLWAKCGAEYIHLMEAFQNLEFSGSDKTLLGKQKLLTTLTFQDPNVKKTILDCLRDKSMSFPVSGEDEHTKNWYNVYSELFFPRYDGASIRRSLAEANAPAISPSPSPSSSSMAPSTENSPSASFFPKDLNGPSSDKDMNATTDPVQNAQSNNGDNSNRKKIIIAVVVTATVTFLVAALLFCCYYRTCGIGRRKNDERPLLSLSLSDYSTYDASQKPSYGNSNLQKMDSSVNGKVFVDSGVSLGIPLEPRVESTLKLPPGRAESSLRPPLVTGAPRPLAAAPPRPAATPPPPPPPRGPPPPPPMKAGPRPPPPPMGGAPPPRPPGAGMRPPRPAAGPSHSSADEADPSKAKLKPFFWDKVMANPDQSMVWHQIKSGSFQFNEEMIETLFGYNATEKNKSQPTKGSSSQDPAFQNIQIIDPKKAQNLSILLKALNVTTEEVRDALKEGNELPVELVQTLIKMAPTADEELKLRVYNGDRSRLGNAERFLKMLVEIPFAFKRLESLLLMSTLQEEESMIKDSFITLEAACVELRKSRLFLKLLEAVLKTGNRMNDGTFRGSAQAFKLDTLLKLSDVKGIDGKTTLLHFVVQEIIRSEGMRAARTARESKSFRTEDLFQESSSEDKENHYCSLGLQVVSGLSNELENVKKAAIIDADGLTSSVSNLGRALVKSRDFLNTDMQKIEEKDDKFRNFLSGFVQNSEKEIVWMVDEEKRIMSLVKNTADYFHGNSGKDEGLRLFVIVRDFLIILDKVCKEVRNVPLKPGIPKKDEKSTNGQSSVPDQRHRLFPAIAERRMHSSSSDED